MLRIIVPTEFDEKTEKFVISKGLILTLEHSLASLSKWESRWEQAFLGDKEKTEEQVLDYVRMMILGDPVSDDEFSFLVKHRLPEIIAYIDARMTATWFPDKQVNRRRGQEVATSELIYYWMISLGIPFEPCENWHLNKLLALIRVCNMKNTPKGKMNRAEYAARQRELNAIRRQQTGSRG